MKAMKTMKAVAPEAATKAVAVKVMKAKKVTKKVAPPTRRQLKKAEKDQNPLLEIAKKLNAAVANSPTKMRKADEKAAAVVKRAPKKSNVETPQKKLVKEATKAVPEVVPTAPRPEKPKRPAAGAWGVFLQERRDEIVKSLPAGHKITDVTKKAAEQWKALTEDERKPFEERYKEKAETYKTAALDYEKACVEGGFSLETPSKKQRIMINHVTPNKQMRMVKVAAESVGPLDPEALHEANGLGYDYGQAFRSLASCTILIENKVPHAKIVRALRASGGSEKKAFAALRNC